MWGLARVPSALRDLCRSFLRWAVLGMGPLLLMWGRALDSNQQLQHWCVPPLRQPYRSIWGSKS